jgi:hypothetical protein
VACGARSAGRGARMPETAKAARALVPALGLPPVLAQIITVIAVVALIIWLLRVLLVADFSLNLPP